MGSSRWLNLVRVGVGVGVGVGVRVRVRVRAAVGPVERGAVLDREELEGYVPLSAAED